MEHSNGLGTLFCLTLFLACAGAFECNRTVVDGPRSFALTQAVLDDVSGDIQQVVDCVSPQESIIVDAGLTMQLTSTARLTKEVVFKSAETGEERPVLKCPKGMPLFEVRSTGVVLQNLIVSDCGIEERDSSAVVVDIVDAQTENDEERPDVLIENVDFLHNENLNGPGAMYLNAAASVALVNVTFMNNTGRNGGAVGLHADGSRILFDKCAFLENIALDRGGTIFQNSSADLTVSGSSFLRNEARLSGGAVFVQGGQLLSRISVSSSNFESNSVSNDDALSNKPPEHTLMGGGAVSLQGPHLKFMIISTNFTKNSADTDGGGVLIRGLTSLSLISGYFESVRFVNNIAEAGGGLSIQSSSVNTTIGVRRGRFIGNVATDEAFTFSKSGSKVITRNSTTQDMPAGGLLKNHTSRPRGGAIQVENGVKIVIQECILKGNHALQTSSSSHLASGGALYLQASEGESTAMISNSSFTENEANEAGAVALDGPCAVEFEDNVSFERNTATEQGGAIVIGQMSTVRGKNAVFSINQAGTSGGAVALKGKNNRIMLTSSVFKGNEAVQGSGGAMFVLGDGSVVQLMSETVLVGNSAKVAGGALAIFCTNCLIDLSQVSIDENSSQDSGGGIFAKSIGGDTDIILSDVAFKKNSVRLMDSEQKESTGSGGALMVEGTGVKLSTLGYIYFHMNKAREGAAIRLVDCGVVTVDNAVFESNSGSSGGGIYATFANKANNQTLYMTNATFIANSAFVGGGLMVDGARYLESYSLEDSLQIPAFKSNPSPASTKVVLAHVNMRYQSVVEEGSGLFLINTKATCSDCVFHGNTVHNLRNGFGGAISLRRDAYLYIVNSVLSRNSAAIGGGASIIDSTFIGEGLEIANNTASDFGGGVSVMGIGETGRATTQLHLDMEECSLEGNSAKTGAGIGINVKETSIPEDCVPFIQNMMAGSSMVPSIEEGMYQEVDSNCNRQDSIMVKLENVRMEHNVAEEAGGGLYFDRPGAVCACCEKSCTLGCRKIAQAGTKSLLDVCSSYWTNNNVMRGYGQDVASAPVSVEVVDGRGEDLGHNLFLAKDHNSGHALQEFTLRFLDISGHVITNSPLNAFVRLAMENGSLSGQVDKALVSGLATFTDAIVSGAPGDYEIVAQLPSEFNLPDEILRISIRECTPGEYAQNIGTDKFRCIECDDQTYSSHPNSACRKCPENTICDGKSISPVDGFWMSSSDPNKAHKCLVQSACRTPSEQSRVHTGDTWAAQNGSCVQGYEGIMCARCSPGYGRFRRFECRECSSKARNVAYITVTSVWSIFLLWFVTSHLLKPRKILREVQPMSERRLGSRSRSQLEITPSPVQNSSQIQLVGPSQSAEAAKILVNFVQLTSIASLVQLQWPKAIQTLLKLEDGLSGIAASDGLFFYDCLLQKWSQSLLLRQSLYFLAVPGAVFALLIVLQLVRALLRPQEWTCFLSHLITSAIVFTHLFYTGVIQRVISLVHGIRLVETTPANGLGTQYWVDGFISRYFSDDHLLAAFILGIPAAIILVGYPLSIVRILRARQQQPYDAGLATRYGFLYVAYKERYVHWELTVIIRKVLIVSAVLFGGPWHPRLQGIACLTIMVVALVAHLAAQPYREEVSGLNRLEAISLFGTTFTYLAGLVYEETAVSKWMLRFVSICLIVFALFIMGCISKAILSEGLEHIDAWLVREGIAGQDAPRAAKTRALREWLWRKSMKLFWNQIERMNGDRAWYVERKNTIANRVAEELERAHQLGILPA